MIALVIDDACLIRTYDLRIFLTKDGVASSPLCSSHGLTFLSLFLFLSPFHCLFHIFFVISALYLSSYSEAGGRPWLGGY